MTPEWIEFGFKAENKGTTLPWFKQVHGKRVLHLEGKAPGATPEEADAGFTFEWNAALHVFTADCIPVLLYGMDREAPIAAIHAGWRGAMLGVVEATLKAIDIPATQTFARIGPSIGNCCFEVQQDFVDPFKKAGRPIEGFLENRGEKRFCRLVDFVRQVALSTVPASQIDTASHRCTVCSLPLLPSYRRNGKADPQIRTWIRKRLA